MQINLIIYPFIILLGFLFMQNDSKHNRKWYIIICSLILILESSLRSLSIGSDTFVYFEQFNDISNSSWSNLWSMTIARYIFGIGDYDIGYLLLQKFISTFTNSFQIFTFVAELLFFVPMGIMLYRYTTNIKQLIFAFVIYISFMHIIAMSGGRQLYAIGLGIMAFIYCNDKHYYKAIVCILIATTFHMSSLIVLLPLGLGFLKARYLKIIHLLLFLLIPAILSYPDEIIRFMGNTIGSEKYANYGSEVTGGATTFIIMIEVMALLCYVAFSRKALESNIILKKMYVMSILFTIVGPLIIANGSMIRLSMYFHLYLMLLVPYAIEKLVKNKKDGNIIYVVFIGVLILLSLKDGGLNYSFFWQDSFY